MHLADLFDELVAGAGGGGAEAGTDDVEEGKGARVVAAVVGDYPAGDCTELFLPQRLSPPLPAVVWLWVVAKTA